jgi:hypothetical protein
MTKKIKMEFKCNQDWDQMTVSGHGRHCDLCSRVVHDFSNKSTQEIAGANSREMCGMFLTEQVETHLTPINVKSSLRTTVLTIGVFLGLELSQGHAQAVNTGYKVENAVTPLSNTDTPAIVKTQSDASQSMNWLNAKKQRDQF